MRRICLKIIRGLFFYCSFGLLMAADFILFSYRDLEKAVEDLSELLESPIEAENIPTLRQQVTNKTVCLFLPSQISSYPLSNSTDSRPITILGVRTQTKQDHFRRHCSWGRWRWNVVVDGFDDPED